jgi:beta-phosphoglucomutase-like phosphatase (HAD superfamily)
MSPRRTRTIRPMLGVVLFDLGDTLVDGVRPFPHVPEALSALTQFTTSGGAALKCALVSDFTMATPPTPANKEALLAEYLGLLDGFGLRRFFEPVGHRVTLSTLAGVMKPDRRIFELALTRLGAAAQLTDCLTVTENAAHIAACRAMGMHTLQFGEDFTDWSEFGLLVRKQLGPKHVGNTAPALGVWLTAHTDLHIIDVPGPVTAGSARIRVHRPADGPTLWATATFDGAGRVAALDVDDNGP